jgi:hypothetical protein
VRIPHKQLEAARHNPRAFVESLRRTDNHPYVMHFRYLTLAVYRFHRSGLRDSIQYLEDHFADREFTEASLRKYQRLLVQYVHRFQQTGETIVKVMDRLEIPLGYGVFLTGEVGRIGLTPHGLTVWLFERMLPDHWTAQLRMPLIQEHYADLTLTPGGELRVGVYGFENGVGETHIFDNLQLRQSGESAGRLANRLVIMERTLARHQDAYV